MAPTTPGKTVPFRVLLDGKPPGPVHGTDVDDQGNGTLRAPRLYQLVRQSQPIGDRQFEIEFLDPGAEAFAFTFGYAGAVISLTKAVRSGASGMPMNAHSKTASFTARRFCAAAVAV